MKLLSNGHYAATCCLNGSHWLKGYYGPGDRIQESTAPLKAVWTLEGGAFFLEMKFCPWCGAELPKSPEP